MQSFCREAREIESRKGGNCRETWLNSYLLLDEQVVARGVIEFDCLAVNHVVLIIKQCCAGLQRAECDDTVAVSERKIC